MNKIILIGSGGRGIKFLGKIFGEYLITLGYEVALTYSYDAPVRGGNIIAFITFDKEKIETPKIDKADIALYFSNNDRQFSADKTIRLTKKEQTNMFAFGVLLKELELDFKIENIKKILPEKQKDQNLKEIKNGYENQN